MGIFEETVALVKGDEILDYIPQRPPIVMVDTLMGIHCESAFSALIIPPDNLFVENGFLNEAGMIEHVAQSCALRLGYECKQKNMPIPTGYIAALKNIEIKKLPKAGERIITHFIIAPEIFGIRLVRFMTMCRPVTTVSIGEMKIFLDNKNEKSAETSLVNP